MRSLQSPLRDCPKPILLHALSKTAAPPLLCIFDPHAFILDFARFSLTFPILFCPLTSHFLPLRRPLSISHFFASSLSLTFPIVLGPQTYPHDMSRADAKFERNRP